jgi:threonine dehydratase
VRAAARRIEGRVLRTPLRESSWLSTIAGGTVRLKLETLQPTFSYKIRGAFNTILRLIEEHPDQRQPLVTASAGNHGSALARAARFGRFPLVVYASAAAPKVKLDGMREEGADVRLCRDYDEAELTAKQHGTSGDAVFISPYAHPDVIAGAGTAGLEIVDDWPEVDTIVVAVGGGGLIGGIALAAREAKPRVSVVGVEAEASSPFTAGLAAGRIVEIDVRPTLADGLAGNLDPDTPTFAIVRSSVDRIVQVSEANLRSAVAGVVRHEHLIAEGAGAAGIAALLAGGLDLRGQNVAVVLSGANIDPGVLRDAIGWSATG